MGSNLCLLHWQVDSLPLSHQGSPIVCVCVCVYNNLLYQKKTTISAKDTGGFTHSFIHQICMKQQARWQAVGKLKLETVSSLEGLMKKTEIETESSAIWSECNQDFEPPCYTLKAYPCIQITRLQRPFTSRPRRGIHHSSPRKLPAHLSDASLLLSQSISHLVLPSK